MFKIAEIKQGMKLKCLNCKKPIILTDETIFVGWRSEYIKCPHCEMAYDIQDYHIYGEFAESEDE